MKDRSKSVLALGALVALAWLVLPARASAEPVGCQRAIARETAKLARADLSALQKCAAARLAGKMPQGTDCRTDGTVVSARIKAEGKHAGAIAKACGGRNKICNAADTGADADDPLAAIGWDQGTCPGFESGSCGNAIADCAGVATCLACVSEAAVAQAVATYAGSGPAGAPKSDLNKCQSAIVREAAKFFDVRAAALAKCEDQVVRGLIAGPCPSGDAKTVATIAKADAAKAAKICKACGGDDAACGGSDDLAPDTIGFTPTCPPVGIGTSCGGPVATLGDLLACATCITEFKTDCLDALAVPGEKPYPNACAVQPTPTPTATATPTLTPTPTPTFTPPAGPVAIACERAIVKEAASLARTRAQTLAKCESDKQSGKVPLATDCLAGTKAGPKVAKAEQRLAERVGKACGGANKTCNSADVGPDADASLPEIGWGALLCPGFEDTHCVAPIVDCAGVAGCITCVHAAAVDQAIALAFAPAVPENPSTPAGACQLAVGRATTSLLLARSKALQKCADASLKGGTPGTCPDAKASAAFAKAENKFLATMCKGCGGPDHLCGGGDDLSPATLGFPTSCPSVTGPSGSCAGPIASLTDLAQCMGCVTGFKNECLDEIAIPDLRGYAPACRPGGPATTTPTPTQTPGGVTPTAPTPTATPGGGVCGNNVVEAGEDCDDGNTQSCDACPSNCKNAPVACPTVGRFVQPVHLSRTDAQALTSALFCLEYPVGTVALPGTGAAPGRVSGFPGQSSVNDFNNAARVALLGQQQLTDINVNLSFDLCTGASPPLPTDYTCSVVSASLSGTAVDPALVTCTAVTP